MSEVDAVRAARVWRLRDHDLVEEAAAVVVEEPLEIFVDEEPYAVLMRTPGDDLALAAGFCLAEGLVEGEADLVAVRHCEQEERNRVFVMRSERRRRDCPVSQKRHLPVVSSCGLCGREMVEQNLPSRAQAWPACRVSVSSLLEAGARLAAAQRHFKATGGTHAAAIFDLGPRLLSVGEDIGRHNALDKAIGRLLLSGGLAEARLAALSGRCSFEMVQKAARAGIPVVASVSAPTHLAVEFAARAGITLVGFVRETSLTVYVDHGRIVELLSTGGS